MENCRGGDYVEYVWEPEDILHFQEKVKEIPDITSQGQIHGRASVLLSGL